MSIANHDIPSIYKEHWRGICETYLKEDDHPRITRTYLSKYINLFIKGLPEEDNVDALKFFDIQLIEALFLFLNLTTRENFDSLAQKAAYLKRQQANEIITPEKFRSIENAIRNPKLGIRKSGLLAALFQVQEAELKGDLQGKINNLNEGLLDNEGDTVNTTGGSKWPYNKIFRIIWIAIIVLTIAFLTYYFWNDAGVILRHGKKAWITKPKDGDQVTSHAILMGKQKLITKSEVLWITVYSHYDELYFPEGGFVKTNPVNEKWSYELALGTPYDTGKAFTIYLSCIDTTQDSYLFLNKYLAKKNKHGMDTLFCNYIDMITVKRK